MNVTDLSKTLYKENLLLFSDYFYKIYFVFYKEHPGDSEVIVAALSWRGYKLD